MLKISSKSITISFLGYSTIFSLCLLVFSGCDFRYSIRIKSPADVSTFESGDSITFSMSLTKSTAFREIASIAKGTIIQWTSSRNGDFWQEEIMQELTGESAVTYHQEFSTSALSAGDHTITCRANTINESGITYNLATAKVRIYISESQTSSTTTTTTASSTTTTASADQRFIDNGDGTVTDTSTGLIWLKNANPCSSYKTWAEAGTYCSSLANGIAGLTDGSTAGQWRLPSIQELEGIGTDPPTTFCLDGTCFSAEDNDPPIAWIRPYIPFTNIQQTVYYWSGTSYPSSPDHAWAVHVNAGYVGNFVKSNPFYVWPVRDEN